MAFLLEEPPNGWLVCDGSTVETEDYPELINIPGIVNNNDNTLILPDMRGEFLRGNTTVREIGSKQSGTKHIAIMSLPPLTTPTGEFRLRMPTTTVLGGNISSEDMDSTIALSSNETVRITSAISVSSSSSTFKQFTSRPNNTSILFCIKYTSTFQEDLIISNNENN